MMIVGSKSIQSLPRSRSILREFEGRNTDQYHQIWNQRARSLETQDNDLGGFMVSR